MDKSPSYTCVYNLVSLKREKVPFPDERKHTFRAALNSVLSPPVSFARWQNLKVSHFDFFLFFISHPERAHPTPPASEKLLSDSVKTFTLQYTPQSLPVFLRRQFSCFSTLEEKFSESQQAVNPVICECFRLR